MAFHELTCGGRFCLNDIQRRQRQPIPVLLSGKSHGQRSLVGYSSWGRKELDTTERLHFCFSLLCFRLAFSGVFI